MRNSEIFNLKMEDNHPVRIEGFKQVEIDRLKAHDLIVGRGLTIIPNGATKVTIANC